MAISPEQDRILTALIAGVAGTLIPAFINWSHDRDANAARMRKLDEAIKRVTFWDQWLRVSIQLATPKDMASMAKIEKELASLRLVLETDAESFHQQVVIQQAVVQDFKDTRHALPRWRKILLFYAPERALAWFPRLLFYLGLLLMVILIIIVLSDHNKSAFDALYVFGFLGLIWCYVFRSLSRWLEQPSHTAPPADIPPPPIPTSEAN